MHRIRQHIIQAIGRNPQRLYGEKRLNPKLQTGTEQAAKTLIGVQTIRHRLKKLKDSLHRIAERSSVRAGTEDEQDELESSVEERNQQTKFTKRVASIINLVEPDAIQAYFGSTDHEEIWREMNTQQEHRDRVIEWLDAMITDNLSEELKQMNRQAQALKVQEAYRTSKGIAMKRFIDKEQSPRCQMEKQIVTEHFATAWARPQTDFREAEQGTPFALEPKITDNEQEEMEAFMLNDRNIEEVIKSRQDLSASGIDGISYEIIKSASKKGVKFMKLPVRTCIKNGKIIQTWEEARPILIHQNGDRSTIQNWRSISITNCFYRICTCLLERAIQATNSKVHIYSGNHKGFIKKQMVAVNMASYSMTSYTMREETTKA
jgi:hypothetical protein